MSDSLAIETEPQMIDIAEFRRRLTEADRECLLAMSKYCKQVSQSFRDFVKWTCDKYQLNFKNGRFYRLCGDGESPDGRIGNRPVKYIEVTPFKDFRGTYVYHVTRSRIMDIVYQDGQFRHG